MKSCPICHARSFDDAEVCFGCLHRFEAEPGLNRSGVREVGSMPRRQAAMGAVAGAGVMAEAGSMTERAVFPATCQVSAEQSAHNVSSVAGSRPAIRLTDAARSEACPVLQQTRTTAPQSCRPAAMPVATQEGDECCECAGQVGWLIRFQVPGAAMPSSTAPAAVPGSTSAGARALPDGSAMSLTEGAGLLTVLIEPSPAVDAVPAAQSAVAGAHGAPESHCMPRHGTGVSARRPDGRSIGRGVVRSAPAHAAVAVGAPA